MTQYIAIKFYDHQSDQAVDAVLSFDQSTQQVLISWQDKHNQTQQRQLLLQGDYLPAVGGVPAAFEFFGGGRIEFVQGTPNWLMFEKRQLFEKISHLENSWSWVAISVLIIAVIFYGLIKFAIPTASYHLAHNLPADSLAQAGDLAQEQLYELTQPSQLSQQQQAHIQQLYNKLNPTPQAKIIFRQGGDFGANAFAIPNNSIVITDE